MSAKRTQDQAASNEFHTPLKRIRRQANAASSYSVSPAGQFQMSAKSSSAYDTFPANEFSSWIDDIKAKATAALEKNKALDEEFARQRIRNEEYEATRELERERLAAELVALQDAQHEELERSIEALRNRGSDHDARQTISQSVDVSNSSGQRSDSEHHPNTYDRDSRSNSSALFSDEAGSEVDYFVGDKESRDTRTNGGVVSESEDDSISEQTPPFDKIDGVRQLCSDSGENIRTRDAVESEHDSQEHGIIEMLSSELNDSSEPESEPEIESDPSIDDTPYIAERAIASSDVSQDDRSRSYTNGRVFQIDLDESCVDLIGENDEDDEERESEDDEEDGDEDEEREQNDGEDEIEDDNGDEDEDRIIGEGGAMRESAIDLAQVSNELVFSSPDGSHNTASSEDLLELANEITVYASHGIDAGDDMEIDADEERYRMWQEDVRSDPSFHPDSHADESTANLHQHPHGHTVEEHTEADHPLQERQDTQNEILDDTEKNFSVIRDAQEQVVSVQERQSWSAPMTNSDLAATGAEETFLKELNDEVEGVEPPIEDRAASVASSKDSDNELPENLALETMDTESSIDEDEDENEDQGNIQDFMESDNEQSQDTNEASEERELGNDHDSQLDLAKLVEEVPEPQGYAMISPQVASDQANSSLMPESSLLSQDTFQERNGVRFASNVLADTSSTTDLLRGQTESNNESVADLVHVLRDGTEYVDKKASDI